MFGTAAAAAVVVVVFSQEEAKLKKVFFLLLRTTTTTNNNTRTISMGTGACNLYGDTSESRRPSSFSSCVYFLATSIDQKKKKTPLRFFSLSLSFFLSDPEWFHHFFGKQFGSKSRAKTYLLLYVYVRVKSRRNQEKCIYRDDKVETSLNDFIVPPCESGSDNKTLSVVYLTK